MFSTESEISTLKKLLELCSDALSLIKDTESYNSTVCTNKEALPKNN